MAGPSIARISSVRVTDENGQVVRTADTTPLRQLLVKPMSTSTLVRQGMRAVINDKRGTAFGKFTVPVDVAGKTGTAEYGDAIAVKGKPLTYQRQHAWFTAFAPYENPEVVVAVLIVGGGEGTTFAAPAAERHPQCVFQCEGESRRAVAARYWGDWGVG